MNIYLVSRNDEAWYDEQVSVVVSAINEQAAREQAAKTAGNEGQEIWLNDAYSKVLVVGLSATSHPWMICRNFNAG
jgi:hypothetical protein